jgi:UDP-N-acetylmuramate--alanine ligase
MHYHLIGIGGVSMSAIALMLHDRGCAVTGSDRQESDVVRRLRAAGVEVVVGHDARNVNGADAVVYTAAIAQDNPEIVEARRRGIPVIERPEMLGKLMESYERRIAISGAHGKTTTTAMISAILEHAGLDPTALLGTDRDNLRRGGQLVIVTEACEAFRSFLSLSPSIGVILNIDADHLDYYGTIERVEAAFREFAGRVDVDGCVIAGWDDARVRHILLPLLSGEGRGEVGRRIIRFGIGEDADFRALDLDVSTPKAAYTLVCRGERLGRVRLGVPGEQNVVDSLAAAAVAFELGVEFDVVNEALQWFRGAARRFEILLDGEVMVVDDYAHHPAEIEATLKSARAAYGRRIIAVFQPHLYSRTQHLMDDFARALSLADEVILTPIYAAREEPIEGVTGESIVNRMREMGFASARYASDTDALPEELARLAKPGDMVLILGAGDIRAVGERLAEVLRQ